MSIFNAFKSQLARQFSSRKVQQAIATVVGVILSKPLKRIGFTDAEVSEVTWSIIAVGVTCIAGIAHEDAAAKSAPQVQTNVDSEVTNAAPKGPTPDVQNDPVKPQIPGSTPLGQWEADHLISQGLKP